MTQQEYCLLVNRLDQMDAEINRWFEEAMYQLKRKYFYQRWSIIWCGISLMLAFWLLVFTIAH